MSYRYNLFYVIQPKIDTKGQAYTLALQHLLTGVYIAELALIGFFGLQQARGPSIMTGLLFIVTVIYNVLMNKYMSPLEKFLPADLVSLAEQDERTPLLSSAEEGRVPQSALVPPLVAEHIINPTARFFDPHAFTSYRSTRAWIRDEEGSRTEDPKYTDEELERAYLHPALWSQTPVIWMARDTMHASENEVRETEECGLKVSDEGAWLDGRRIVCWNVADFEKVPVWKKAVKY